MVVVEKVSECVKGCVICIKGKMSGGGGGGGSTANRLSTV